MDQQLLGLNGHAGLGNRFQRFKAGKPHRIVGYAHNHVMLKGSNVLVLELFKISFYRFAGLFKSHHFIMKMTVPKKFFHTF